MRRLLAIVLTALSIFMTAAPALAIQTARCDGPAEICAQIMELRAKLDAQKSLDDKEKTEAERAVAEKDKARTAKAMAAAATMAVILKLFLSSLRTWRGYFKSDRGKGLIKLITVVVGFAAFLLTNYGMGLDWWQALIVGGGGPGAMLIHDLQDAIPQLLGKKPPSDPSPPELPPEAVKDVPVDIPAPPADPPA